MIGDDRNSRLKSQLREGIRHFKGLGKLLNEATTRSVLISPILETLGYWPTYRLPEYHEQGNAPDETCYLHPVDSRHGDAAIILEAKSWGTPFDSAPMGLARADSPDRQIRRYLQQHVASGPNTIGVLTDGVRWRIYQRTADRDSNDVNFVVEHDFRQFERSTQFMQVELQPELQQELSDLIDRLARDRIEYRTVRHKLRAPKPNFADSLFEAIIANPQPEQILKHLLNGQDMDVETDISADVALTGKRKDTHDNDWLNYAYSKPFAIIAHNPALSDEFDSHIVLAVVQYEYLENDPGLSRAEAALCARTLASADASSSAVVLTYSKSPEGNISARLVVMVGNQVNMTVSFDPRLPAPSARTAINRLLQILQDADGSLRAERLLEPLEVAPLRQRLYQEIAKWTGDLQDGRELAEREAVLRHLIRVIFAWILKEEGIIPAELFEFAFVRFTYGAEVDNYHEDVLRFLFHQRLNIPTEMRHSHLLAAIEKAMLPTPFLNGSLFAEHADDEALNIPASRYWNTDKENPGLFTILSRYHWTTNEHRPGESEQTLDPELLSNLFERLIAPTREGTLPPLRQPKGTYYTPADIADEMVKDALVAAVRDHAPETVSEADLLCLFGDSDTEVPQMTDAQRVGLASRIRELRVFDPAVGSGEFLLSMLLAIQRGLGKLEPDKSTTATEIIRQQLAGQDIQPLAVQISRLRLFIAIIAERKNSLAEDKPLPNLEARIVCADTLQTVADAQWRPDRTGQFDATDSQLISALTDLAANRRLWFDSHTEQDKQHMLAQDATRRDHLRILMQNRSEVVSQELIGFAEAPLYDTHSRPALTDTRLLFYKDPWRGFDIVIGNPPYEALSKSKTREQVNALRSKKRYKTGNVGDLYSLFCETALALANPSGGVVTMVVPLSIAFGRRQRTLRTAFESGCREINLRHYNNNPQMMFHTTPTTKDPRNRQRVTVLTALLGNAATQVRSTGLQRWGADERSSCIVQRHTVRLPKLGVNVDARITEQWPRIPSQQVVDMVQSIVAQKRTVEIYCSSGELSVALPSAGEYFISVIPEGKIQPRTEIPLTINDHDELRLIMAALNGHVGYAWWWIYGDGYHVKVSDFAAMTIPDKWLESPQPAIDIGQRLIDCMPDCEVEIVIHKKIWRNVNFHIRSDLIEELDRLHLEALGFTGTKQDKLLSHLRIMRSSSSWNFD